MQNYIIISASSDKTAEERCKEISQALYTIARPQSIRTASDVTNFFCSYKVHPQDSRAALVLNSDDKIVPHEDLVTTDLFDSMTEYTTQKKTAVTTKLNNNHGVEINVGDILPTSFSYTTLSAMETDGWFDLILI